MLFPITLSLQEQLVRISTTGLLTPWSERKKDPFEVQRICVPSR